MSKTDDRVQSLMESLREPMQKLRDAGNVAVPTDAELQSALTGCLSTRDGAWRKTSPPPGNDPAEVLWKLVKFHRSGGSLYGWPWFADRGLTDRMDTVAQVLLLVSGHQLTAVNTWQRAIYG